MLWFSPNSQYSLTLYSKMILKYNAATGTSQARATQRRGRSIELHIRKVGFSLYSASSSVMWLTTTNISCLNSFHLQNEEINHDLTWLSWRKRVWKFDCHHAVKEYSLLTKAFKISHSVFITFLLPSYTQGPPFQWYEGGRGWVLLESSSRKQEFNAQIEFEAPLRSPFLVMEEKRKVEETGWEKVLVLQLPVMSSFDLPTSTTLYLSCFIAQTDYLRILLKIQILM